MLRRSETLFVHQVTAERRKRVVNALYSNFDLPTRTILALRVLASAATLAGSIGMQLQDKSWGYRCDVTYLLWAGCLLWALCAAVAAALTFRNPPADAASIPHAIRGVAAFTARLGGCCLVGIATLASLTLYGYVNTKTDAVVTTCLVSGLLFNAILIQLTFKSFSGVYAPVLPHRYAPTVLPLFALSVGAAAFCCADVGLQFQPQSFVILRLINVFRIVAWAMWFLEALGTFNASYIVHQREVKLRRQQFDEQERTPLTSNSTPQIIKDSSSQQ